MGLQIAQSLSMQPVVSAFPVGFQPGVSHTKLKISFDLTVFTGILDGIEMYDSTFTLVGGMYNVSLPYSAVIDLVNTGDPFSSGYYIIVSWTDSATGYVLDFTQIEFSS